MWRHLMTSKHFRYGLLFTCIGALGIALFGVFRIAAFSYFGPITLPYTTPIDDLSAILFFGSLPISETIALYQWLRGDIKAKENERWEPDATSTQQISPAIILAQETAPVIATLAEANIAPVVAPVTVSIATPAAANLVFVDHEAILVLGDAICQIPPAQNEHSFCRAMFQRRINEFVDWSLIHDEMMGADTITDYEKARRMVYDTYLAINERVEKDLGIQSLFVWRRKMIKRTQ
jgi:hypothetical protein